MCWAHVDDVAAGHVLAMERGTNGDSYMLAGPAASLAEGLVIASRIAGTKGPRLVPDQLVRVGVALTGRLGRLLPLPPGYQAETLRASLATYYGSSARAERELAWHARPLKQGLADTLHPVDRPS